MSLDEIREAQKEWEMDNRVDELPSARRDMGAELPLIYTPADIEDVDYLEDLGFPGQYPFTRGVYPGMYRKNPWQMRLYSGFGTAEDTNKRWKFLLDRGNNGVAVAFDLPTQMGINSDHPHAEDEVGKLGVAIDTLRDMEVLYADLPLDRLISSFNINAPVAIIMAMYIALGEKQGVTSRGLHVDDFARRISFFFATGLQILEEAARYRAARKLWARIMKERLGAKNPRSMLFRFTGTTGGSYYRTREPLNNLVRGAYGLLGNILGGAQGMLHPAWDEPFAIPTEESAQLALRTQQILAYERRMREETSGERVVVGVNRFIAEDERREKREMKFHEPDPQVHQRQIDRLDKVRNERDEDAVKDCLDELKEKARGEENLIPHLIGTVKTYASIEEIMEALKEVFGTFEEPLNI